MLAALSKVRFPEVVALPDRAKLVKVPTLVSDDPVTPDPRVLAERTFDPLI